MTQKGRGFIPQILKNGQTAYFDPEYQCHIIPIDNSEYPLYVRMFESRYYAQKWINDSVPEAGRKIWKIFKIDGYYRTFRYLENEFSM